MNNYEILGLQYGASEEEVKNAYRQKAIDNNPDRFSDPVERRLAQQKMAEIDAAFDDIMNYLRTGNRSNPADEADSFYKYVRSLIQNGQYQEAINQLNTYNNEGEAQWQFLMGSAMYYSGYISQAFPFFQRAVNMEPSNPEYSAAFNRMNQSRQGNIYGSPYSRQTTYSNSSGCCDPCTVCQCLMCMDCCFSH